MAQLNNVIARVTGASRGLPLVPFWEQPLQHWDGMFTAGVRAHLTASRLAVPLMPPQRRGLIHEAFLSLGCALICWQSLFSSRPT